MPPVNSTMDNCLPTSPKKDIAVAAFIFLATLAYLFSFYNYGLNLLDEGYLMMSSLRVLHGEVQYIDFQNNYGPGRFFFLAALFRLFGENFLVTRAAWAVLYAFAAVITYFIARRATRPSVAAVAAAMIVLTRCPWQKTFFVFLQVLCILVCFYYLKNKRTGRLVFCGITASAVMFFRQDLGVYAFIAFSVLLVLLHHKDGARKVIKALSYFASSFAITFSPVIFYYLYRGHLMGMLDQFFFSGARDIRASTLPFPTLAGKGPVEAITVLTVYIPLLVYAASTWLLIHKAIKNKFGAGCDQHLLLLVIFSPLVYIQLFNRTDLPHVWQIFPSAFLLVLFLWADISRNSAGRFKIFVTLILFLVVAIYIISYFSVYNPLAPPAFQPKADYVTLPVEGAHVKLPQPYADELLEVRRVIKENTSKDDYILAVPDIPMFYFLCERRNPLRYDLLRPGIADRVSLQEGIIGALEKKKPNYMILNENETWDGVPARKFQNRSKLIYDYLVSSYIMDKDVGGFSIWRRKTNAL